MARGAVTDETAVAGAILSGKLGGFGTDVYSMEPLGEDHPFFALRNHPHVCLTPHMSWGAVEARERCLAEIIQNMRAFAAGEKRNRLD
jgi:glycerate dehydrogenase